MEYFVIPQGDALPKAEEMPDLEFGIIAGDLSPEYILDAYVKGYFPWYEYEEIPVWFHPNPRCVLFSEKIKVSKSMKHVLKSGKFELRINTNFESIIRNCRERRLHEDDGTWISENFIDAYQILHKKGIAMSYETWFENELAGGLYALKIGKMIFGESMFSKMSNASKFALIHLCFDAQNEGIEMIDCQITNKHLISMGAEEIPREEYMKILNKNIAND